MAKQRFEVRKDANGPVIEIIEREVHEMKGWEWVEYKGKRYQLFGGIRTPWYIDLSHALMARDTEESKSNKHPRPVWPKFFDAYIEAALWSSTDESTESGGYPLDDNYGPEDIDQESIDKAIEETNDFIKMNRADLKKAMEEFGTNEARLGHDFWLNRNGHGSGYWDEGWGALGDRLSKAAKAYGTSDIYVGDDGKLHIQ